MLAKALILIKKYLQKKSNESIDDIKKQVNSLSDSVAYKLMIGQTLKPLQRNMNSSSQSIDDKFNLRVEAVLKGMEESLFEHLQTLPEDLKKRQEGWINLGCFFKEFSCIAAANLRDIECIEVAMQEKQEIPKKAMSEILSRAESAKIHMSPGYALMAVTHFKLGNYSSVHKKNHIMAYEYFKNALKYLEIAIKLQPHCKRITQNATCSEDPTQFYAWPEKGYLADKTEVKKLDTLQDLHEFYMAYIREVLPCAEDVISIASEEARVFTDTLLNTESLRQQPTSTC